MHCITILVNQGGSMVLSLFAFSLMMLLLCVTSITFLTLPIKRHLSDLVDTLAFYPTELWSNASLRSSNVHAKWDEMGTREIVFSWYIFH